MLQHSKYMARCIELAMLGLGSVSPNPMVGAVIICDDRIIGEGFHMKFGEAHAEVNAIKNVYDIFPDAEKLLKRSILYVNLEPCAHFGKTPPCADIIISNNIPTVVVGCRDPFTQVNGKGIERLKNAGIEVLEGVMESDCLELNRRFYTRVLRQRPFIILKWAQSRDGFFALKEGGQKWITSSPAKQLVHRWRSEEDAILIGKDTAKIDNPHLNVREWNGKNPVRIIIDRNLELPKELNIFDQSQDTIIFNGLRTEVIGKIKYLELENFDVLLPRLICYQLYLMDIQSIIIEGGAKILNLFISADLWDEARVFTGPERWGEGIASPVLRGESVETISVGPDTLQVWRNFLI
jgi:diaminohydroxyphosphoribosylaminopyrimidine deaminase/5-amino-6-(5-phosphoribosylamino)uracil reductase